jgi:hypothetical protein
LRGFYLKEKKTGEYDQIPQKYGNRLVRAAKFAFATLEFAALATAGAVKAGGDGVRQLISSPPKKAANQSSSKVPAGNIAEKKTEVEVRTGLEERLASIEKRLLAVEKVHSGLRVLEKGKVAVEVERHNLLVELARITKSYINSPAKK